MWFTIVRLLLKCRFVFGVGPGRIAAVALAALTEVFRGFPKSFQANSEMVLRTDFI